MNCDYPNDTLVKMTEETETTRYYKSQMDNLSENSYPHKFVSDYPRITLKEFHEKYDYFEPEQFDNNVIYSLWGRTHTQRNCGKHIIFMDLNNDDQKLQVMVWDQHYYDQEAFKTLSKISRGYIIGIEGYPYKTKQGELSIRAIKIEVLTPCLHQIPKKLNQKSGSTPLNSDELMAFFGFSDKEKRFRERYLDLVINEQSFKVFKTRSRLITFIRCFLDKKDFMEIETPILNMIPSGANASPFKTHHNDLNTDMFLRIAPELALKMAVVGGFNKVYELGRVFRNEGIDRTHNPEFTSIELYQADADYNTLISLNEELLQELAMYLHGKTQVKYQDQTIDFAGPYPRIDIMDFLTNKFPNFPNINSSTLGSELLDFCINNQVSLPAVLSSSTLLDKIIGHFIEPLCQNPTFICGHPIIMSPLAKPDRFRPGLTERFELFVMGREISNGFTELNDPRIQRKNFEEQQAQKDAGNDEANGMDENFVKALEIGLPPTAGLGIGIDRLVMLMTNQNDIRDVIMFPTMK